MNFPTPFRLPPISPSFFLFLTRRNAARSRRFPFPCLSPRSSTLFMVFTSRFVRFLFAALLCGCVPMGFLFAAIGGKAHDAPGWATALSLLLPALLWLAAGRLKR